MRIFGKEFHFGRHQAAPDNKPVEELEIPNERPQLTALDRLKQLESAMVAGAFTLIKAEDKSWIVENNDTLLQHLRRMQNINHREIDRNMVFFQLQGIDFTFTPAALPQEINHENPLDSIPKIYFKSPANEKTLEIVKHLYDKGFLFEPRAAR